MITWAHSCPSRAFMLAALSAAGVVLFVNLARLAVM